MPHTRPGVRESAVLYFLIGAVFIAGVLGAYGVLRRLPIIHYYERLKREREEHQESLLCMMDGHVGEAKEGGAERDPSRGNIKARP